VEEDREGEEVHKGAGRHILSAVHQDTPQSLHPSSFGRLSPVNREEDKDFSSAFCEFWRKKAAGGS